MGFWDGIRTVLQDADGPLHTRDVTKALLERGLWASQGKTPEATVAARLYGDIKKKGASSQFVQAGKATFALNPNIQSPPGMPDTPPGGGPQPVKRTDGATARMAGDGAGAALKKRLSFTDAAEDVLRRHGNGQPMHYRDVTAKVLEEDLVKTSGRHPRQRCTPSSSPRTHGPRSAASSPGLCATARAWWARPRG